MGRRSRFIVVAAVVLCAASLIALHRSATTVHVRPMTGAAPRPVYEQPARAAPSEPPIDPDVVANSPAVAPISITTPAVQTMDSPDGATDSAPVRETDESSEEFRHSRRGDGQHAE